MAGLLHKCPKTGSILNMTYYHIKASTFSHYFISLLQNPYDCNKKST